jgi:uncharacterized membrane protein YeaQ/YmgE (transglycosylase-associated protein family)
MDGFGILAWLAIGTVAGWTMTRLMVTAGDEALRGTAAGVIGGVLGGLGMGLLESSVPGVNSLNMLVAALAGSFWLTWITCVVTSGRERRSQPRASGVGLPDVDGHPLLGTRLQTLAERVGAG